MTFPRSCSFFERLVLTPPHDLQSTIEQISTSRLHSRVILFRHTGEGIHHAEPYPLKTISDHEWNKLKIMEVLESNPAQSQRDMARKIGVSLGHLNFLINSLVREGYCTVCEVRKSRMAYRLTSKGMDEKSSLTYRYLWSGLTFFQDIQHKFHMVFAELHKRQKTRIVLFRKGQLSEIASGVLKRSNLQLVNTIDHIAELHGLDYDMILILELESHAAVAQKLVSSGISRDKIMRL